MELQTIKSELVNHMALAAFYAENPSDVEGPQTTWPATDEEVALVSNGFWTVAALKSHYYSKVEPIIEQVFPFVAEHLKQAFEYGGEAMSDQISEDYFGGRSNIKRQYVNPYALDERDN